MKLGGRYALADAGVKTRVADEPVQPDTQPVAVLYGPVVKSGASPVMVDSSECCV